MSNLLNFLLYEAGWLACMGASAAGHSQIGIACAAILMAVHLQLHPRRSRQILLMTVAASAGLLVDSLLIAAGILKFTQAGPLPSLPPLWMTVLWAQFATTMPNCLRWLCQRPLLAAALTYVGAPMTFLGGQRMELVHIATPELPSLLLLGSLWAITVPGLLWCSSRLHPGPPSSDDYTCFR
jgi:hypothetical protein